MRCKSGARWGLGCEIRFDMLDLVFTKNADLSTVASGVWRCGLVE